MDKLEDPTFPITRLSPEIRVRILEELLGHRLVHYKVLDLASIERDKVQELRPIRPYTGSGKTKMVIPYNHVCNLTPTAAFAHSTLDVRTGLVKLDITKLRPYGCRNEQPLELNVLLTNHQLYMEASALMWKTNLFFFDEPLSFMYFCQDSQPWQQANTRSLHFCMQYNKMHHFERWEEAITEEHLQGFISLKHLSLELEVLLTRKEWWVLKHFHITFNRHLRALLFFRTFPLQTVTVKLKNAGDSKRNSWNREEAAQRIPIITGMTLTEEGKIKRAGLLEKVLLGKEDEEVQEEDKELSNILENLKKNIDRWGPETWQLSRREFEIGRDIFEMSTFINALSIEDREDF